MTVNPGLVGYDAVRGTRFYQALQLEAAALPGAEAVTVAGSLPLEFTSDGGAVELAPWEVSLPRAAMRTVGARPTPRSGREPFHPPGGWLGRFP